MKSRQPVISLSSYSHITFLFYGFVIIFVITNTTSANSNGRNETDHLALLSFKSMIRKDPYGVLSSWNSSFHFCDWSGVTCGKRHRRVTSVVLESRGLQGSLSPHVGNLSFLVELSLLNNSLEGSIPYEFGLLFRLRRLNLSVNKFNGLIPTNLSGCSDIEELELYNNKLVGSIPKEITFLSKLTVFALDENKLTGGIPPLLGNITSMEEFSVTGNPLGGSIPDTLGSRWKNLQLFYSGGCNLHGSIPRFIFNQSLLTELSSPENLHSGNLPPAMLPLLVVLQLRNNKLTGLLPPSISNSSKFQILEMSENRFRGKLTFDFSKFTDISEISLNDNDFNGHGEADEMKFIDSLKNCSRLKTLNLRNCKFQGVLPNSVGNLTHELHVLFLMENQLYGNLPSSIGNLIGLTNLGLGDNRFTGKIPTSIGKLQNLGILAMYGNQFSGPIPDAFGNLSRGNIPKQLLQLSSLSMTLDLSQNSLSGSLPVEIGDLKMLTQLDLSYNNLSGDIPSSFGGCTSLSYLYINHNFFQGMIPPSLSPLRGLLELDLSHNKFFGQIPRFLEQFSLEYLNLSYNDFEGKVPMLGVFANVSVFSSLGNSRLCGGVVELGLPKCKETRKHRTKGFPFYIVVILIASIVFVILCFVYAWCKKKRKSQSSQSSRWNELFFKVSYNQLLKATDGFSEANLIGHGGFSSVYKGILEHDDKFVAVKVLHLQNRGAQRSFMRECEAWRGIRHRNVLKILTSCSSVDFQGNDFKALVYEFMPNGSLHDWLHSFARTSRLNLLQRINILIDVASALDYLHNHCLTTIVHCDIKPSNILLDENMVAHVGDFGLFRFLGTGSNRNTSTGVKGTIGYTPPEYGVGSEMTSSGDVYSYGILLLELMTGKKPTDDIFNEGLSLHKFASMALPDHVIDVIDRDAIVMQSTKANVIKMECLTSTLQIGVLCSVDSPSQRMKIENVIHELQHILDALQNI